MYLAKRNVTASLYFDQEFYVRGSPTLKSSASKVHLSPIDQIARCVNT